MGRARSTIDGVSTEYLGWGEHGVPRMGEHGVPSISEHGVPWMGEHGVPTIFNWVSVTNTLLGRAVSKFEKSCRYVMA